jgi:nucleoside-diphosphate-sugar epimerase
MSKKRVLVTGGAGFLGINLTRYLLKKDYDVVSYDIASFDYPDVKDKVTAITGDIRDKKALDKAMDGIDLVVHCAAALPLYTADEIYSIDIEGTRNVLAAAKKHGINRVVHISSTAVYGIETKNPTSEDDPLVGIGPYGIAKIESEKVAEEYRKKGLCVPILRPKSFIGPERLGVFALLYDWAKDGCNFPMVGSGKNQYQLLDVEDLCDAIYLTMTLPAVKANDTFNVGAKEFTTMKEDYQVVLDKAGFGKKIRSVPAMPMVLTLRFLEKLHLSPIYKWVYETAYRDSVVTIDKAEKQLGFKPKFSNKDALLRNYAWYLKNEEHFKHTSGVSHRVPWKQGVLSVVKIFFK